MAPPTVQTPQRLAAETGHRLDTLEKVLRLLELLDEIAEEPVLWQRLALKGGTVLNGLLPRLLLGSGRFTAANIARATDSGAAASLICCVTRRP